jgi:hypothetical protein
MAPRTRKGLLLTLLVVVLGAAVSCGAEETIRVDLLPPGNARGSAASGMYFWTETVGSTNCPGSVTVGSTSVALPQSAQRYTACADIVHDEGYYAVDYFAFSVPAGSTVSRPEYAADGGLWQEGQFRIGGIFQFGTGVTARALIDGQYLPPAGTEVVRSFEGVALVQIFKSVSGAESYLCEYNINFNANREPSCGATD